jgi:hypothetical protein
MILVADLTDDMPACARSCCCRGHVVLEVFARKTMSTLFASFFDHILVSFMTVNNFYCVMHYGLL